MKYMAEGRLVGFPDHVRTLYVEQEVIGDERTPLERVLEVDLKRVELLHEKNGNKAKTLASGREKEKRKGCQRFDRFCGRRSSVKRRRETTKNEYYMFLCYL